MQIEFLGRAHQASIDQHPDETKKKTNHDQFIGRCHANKRAKNIPCLFIFIFVFNRIVLFVNSVV